MRYGPPPVATRIDAPGRRVATDLVLSLYPQYSAATTATAMDKCFDALEHAPATRNAQCHPISIIPPI
jgi:ferrochelatase